MKRTCLTLIFISVLFLSYSCRPFKVIGIEVYNPSAITFPPEVKTVMIVNNSAQQPDAIGHRYITNIKGDSSISVSADSTAYYLCMSLGKAIAESPLFHDVRICEDTLRRDSLFYDVRAFTSRDVRSFCANYGVDALISLDKLFFTSISYRNEMPDILFDSSIRVDVAGEFRAYWPGQKEGYSIPFADSLVWILGDAFFHNDAIVEASMPSLQFAMRYLSEIIGKMMHINFVPHWSDDKRWYYTSITSEWKRGTAFAAANKWAEAAAIWEPLFEKQQKTRQKARLASNIALCNEMTGNFKKAIEYAEIAYNLFAENLDAGNDFNRIQKTYINILEKRKESDKTLSKQLGE